MRKSMLYQGGVTRRRKTCQVKPAGNPMIDSNPPRMYEDLTIDETYLELINPELKIRTGKHHQIYFIRG